MNHNVEYNVQNLIENHIDLFIQVFDLPNGCSMERVLSRCLAALLLEEEVQNPSVPFVERAKRGDFDLVTECELAEGMASTREPMTDDAFARRKMQVKAMSRYWADHQFVPMKQLLHNMFLIG